MTEADIVPDTDDDSAVRSLPDEVSGPGDGSSEVGTRGVGDFPWQAWVSFTLTCAGLGISIYLTIVHYAKSVLLSCPNVGPIDCAKVLTSPQSVIFGLPVAAYGLGWFLVMSVICFPLMWRSSSRWLLYGRLALAISGIAFVLYLISVELFTVDKICLWCTGVHVITFTLLVVIITGTSRLLDEADLDIE